MGRGFSHKDRLRKRNGCLLAKELSLSPHDLKGNFDPSLDLARCLIGLNLKVEGSDSHQIRSILLS